jgi:hypothetical protein
MSSESANTDLDQVIARMKSERPAVLNFSGESARPEPTLEEARGELASAIGQLAHTIFSKKYGPLVGTVTKTTAETVLKNAEENLYRAKGDATLVIQELVDRAFTSKQSKKTAGILTIFTNQCNFYSKRKHHGTRYVCIHCATRGGR